MLRNDTISSPVKFIFSAALLTLSTLATPVSADDKAAPRHTGAEREAVQFSIVLSKDWKTSETNVLEHQKSDGTNLSVKIVKDPSDLKELEESVAASFPKQMKNWKSLEDKMVTIDGKKALKISGSFEVEIPKGPTISVTNIQYYIRSKNDTYYIVTFSAASSKFDGIKKEFEDAADSIQVD